MIRGILVWRGLLRLRSDLGKSGATRMIDKKELLENGFSEKHFIITRQVLALSRALRGECEETDKRVARALMGIILLLGGAPLAPVKKLTGMYEEVE